MSEAIERTSPTIPVVRNEDTRRDREHPTSPPAEPRRPAHAPHKGVLLDVVV